MHRYTLPNLILNRTKSVF